MAAAIRAGGNDPLYLKLREAIKEQMNKGQSAESTELGTKAQFRQEVGEGFNLMSSSGTRRHAQLPPRTTETMSDAISISSPSGNVSKAAAKMARARLSEKLFGKGGLQRTETAQPTAIEAMLRQASQLRDLASRGMKPRAYIKKAEELEAVAKRLTELTEK